MPEEILYPDAAYWKEIGEVVKRYRTDPRGGGSDGARNAPANQLPLIVQEESNSVIPARSGSTLGTATVKLFKKNASSGAIEEITGATRDIVNTGGGIPGDMYAVAIPNPHTGDYYTFFTNNILKGKADAEITAGSSGTVSLWTSSGDTGNNVTAYLDWAEGGENVASGAEVLMAVDDEGRYLIIGAECDGSANASYTESETDDLLEGNISDGFVALAYGLA